MLFMIKKQVSQHFPCGSSVLVFACVGCFENLGNFKFNRIYQVLHLTHI